MIPRVVLFVGVAAGLLLAPYSGAAAQNGGRLGNSYVQNSAKQSLKILQKMMETEHGSRTFLHP